MLQDTSNTFENWWKQEEKLFISFWLGLCQCIVQPFQAAAYDPGGWTHAGVISAFDLVLLKGFRCVSASFKYLLYTLDVGVWLELHYTQSQAVNDAPALSHRCNRLFLRALWNTGMVDRVLLRPFNSWGTTHSCRPGGSVRAPWLPSAETSAVAHTLAQKGPMTTYFTLYHP